MGISGQAQIGWNWDAYLWDSSKNELNDLYQARKQETPDEQAKTLLARAIHMNIDSEIYQYVAHISCMYYVESSASLIYFYSPALKRLIVGVDFS